MILIFSDSHDHCYYMTETVKKLGKEAECIIHLGDYAKDTSAIKRCLPDTPLFNVAGNCDFFDMSKAPADIETEIGGKKFFLTHGHKYHVKTSYDDIIKAAESRDADVCLFGHTHRPDIFRSGGVLFLNPGSVHMSRGIHYPTYGVISITDGIEASAVQIKDGAAKPLALQIRDI